MTSWDFAFDGGDVAGSNDFDLRTLSADEIKQCKDIAYERVRIQVEDAKNGDGRASNSYGGRNTVESRPLEVRQEDALMGTLAEYICSKRAKCVWTKEMGQYKGNSNPDMSGIFMGQPAKFEVRGTRRTDSVVYRPHQDVRKPDSILIAVTNLPNGPLCKVGHAFFRDITELVNQHPEWRGNSPGAPFYWIPFDRFSQDFSKFGE